MAQTCNDVTEDLPSQEEIHVPTRVKYSIMEDEKERNPAARSRVFLLIFLFPLMISYRIPKKRLYFKKDKIREQVILKNKEMM